MARMILSVARLVAILALMTLTICLVFCDAEGMVPLLLSKVAVWPSWLLLRGAWRRWGEDPLVARVIR